MQQDDGVIAGWTVWADSRDLIAASLLTFAMPYVDVERYGLGHEKPTVFNLPLKADHVGLEDCIATNFLGRS